MTTPDNTLSPEVVERLVALVRAMASSRSDRAWQYGIEWRNTAQTIVALLPKPVDPDLIEARRIAADADIHGDWREAVMRGDCDAQAVVQRAYEGIRRGRELTAQDPMLAAAPDLLAAAQHVERLYGMDVPAFAVLRAAVSKATGAQS